MKTFIATLALTISLGALANGTTTQIPGSTRYNDTMDSEQQRMEESKMKMENHANGAMETVQKPTTKETPIMNHNMEKDMTTTRKTKKMR